MIMLVKSLEERVQDAFGKDGNSGSFTAKDFLQQLDLDNQNLRSGFRSSVIRLFFFFGLFILLSTASVSEATIGPIKITNLSIIIKCLPLLIAVNYYELISLYGTSSLLWYTTYAICHKYFESFDKSDLDFFFNLNFFADFEKFSGWAFEDGVLKTIDGIITIFLTAIILFAAFLFECYAFYFCFSTFGVYDLFMWIILFSSIVVIAKTVIVFYCIGTISSA